jgi:uncharacterized protein (TIGR04255 family)
MPERPSNLPDYRKPPIDEVVVGVQFRPVDGLTDDRIREFWKEVRDEYPISERQPRLEGPIDTLEPARQLVIQLPTPATVQSQLRMWMISDGDDFLLQVQSDRFIQNWRRRASDYGHFEEIRDMFWTNFGKFKSYLDSEGIPVPSVQQVEVTYFNWVADVSITDYLRPAQDTVISVSGIPHYPEEQSWSAKYLLGTDNGVVRRLYIQCVPAIRPQTPDVRGSQLALIYRATRESGLGDDELAALIDSARIMIVETFTALTTEAAHDIWEREK